MLKKVLLSFLLCAVCFAIQDVAIAADEVLQYKESSIDDTSRPTRKRAQVSIYLVDPKISFTSDQLAATCAAAAKYYAQKYDLQLVGIFLSDIPGGQGWEGTRLAQCQYSPDNGGANGKQGWTWDMFQVADRPLTDQERKMKKLWGEMRGKFQKDGATDEDALSGAIAKIMKIKAEEVTLPYLFLNSVDVKKFEDIDANGPQQ